MLADPFESGTMPVTNRSCCSYRLQKKICAGDSGLTFRSAYTRPQPSCRAGIGSDNTPASGHPLDEKWPFWTSAASGPDTVFEKVRPGMESEVGPATFRRYIRDGSLFQENAVAKTGL